MTFFLFAKVIERSANCQWRSCCERHWQALESLLLHEHPPQPQLHPFPRFLSYIRFAK